MSVAERKVRDKEKLRKLILETAAQIIAEEGPSDLKIRDLADRIEYSPRTIYLYFADKKNLIEEVVEEGFRQTAINLPPLNSIGANPGEVLKGMIVNHMAMAFSNPNYYRAVVSTLSGRDFRPGPAQEKVNRFLSEVLASYIPGKTEKPEDRDFLRNYLMIALRSYTLAALQNGEPLQPAELLAERFFSLVIYGLSGEVNEK